MTSLTIYTDADNTLWDTDAVFREAQLALLAEMEQSAARAANSTDRLAFVREYDQAIASQHHERLRYPPSLLAHALVLGLNGASHAEAARRAMRSGPLSGTEDSVQRFLKMLKALPTLLPGVREGVRLAMSLGARLYVVTEGPQEKVVHLLREHDLFGSVVQVLSATKTTALYSRLKTLSGGTPVAMIGDQLDRDVVLAHESGLLTVWIPSAFRPKWNDGLSAENASFVAADFLSAISWLFETTSTSDPRAVQSRIA